MDLLQTIHTPADLRKLSYEDLSRLSEEIRTYIVETVSHTGGHLASNLGAVELTLALHYAFDTPNDKIVWDVGHQCYTHKIVTGRKYSFSELRQKGGISGFCNREESPYDTHTTGHSSNSISLALGMAQARKLSGGKEHVVAVLGDGALTGGMALEALNHAGHLDDPLIVVLNDNNMSIAGNVGALAQHMAKFRTAPHYNKVKEFVKEELGHRKERGQKWAQLIKTGKNRIKAALIPGMFFENLGFTYLGPFDGHDIKTLVYVMQQAKTVNGPVLVHIRTTKGKGYAPAEHAPADWHGVAPFFVESGKPMKEGKPTFTSVFSHALPKLAAENKDIVAITAAMTDGTGLHAFAEQFPDRFYDTGITEQHAATFAAGLASAGKRPVLALYSTFLQRAYDQIMQDIAIQHLHVVLAVDRAGLVGEDGETHHGVFDMGLLRQMPGMSVLCPASCLELSAMLEWAAEEYSGPVAIRYPRGGDGSFSGCDWDPFDPISVHRTGSDCVIITYGTMVNEAQAAAEILAGSGIEASVIRLLRVHPLPMAELMPHLTGIYDVFVVEEACNGSGLCDAIAARLKGRSVHGMDLGTHFVSHGSVKELYHAHGVDAEGIAKYIQEVHRDEN